MGHFGGSASQGHILLRAGLGHAHQAPKKEIQQRISLLIPSVQLKLLNSFSL
jgi:hypothetical protein